MSLLPKNINFHVGYIPVKLVYTEESSGTKNYNLEISGNPKDWSLLSDNSKIPDILIKYGFDSLNNDLGKKLTVFTQSRGEKYDQKLMNAIIDLSSSFPDKIEANILESIDKGSISFSNKDSAIDIEPILEQISTNLDPKGVAEELIRESYGDLDQVNVTPITLILDAGPLRVDDKRIDIKGINEQEISTQNYKYTYNRKPGIHLVSDCEVEIFKEGYPIHINPHIYITYDENGIVEKNLWNKGNFPYMDLLVKDDGAKISSILDALPGEILSNTEHRSQSSDISDLRGFEIAGYILDEETGMIPRNEMSDIDIKTTRPGSVVIKREIYPEDSIEDVIGEARDITEQFESRTLTCEPI